MEGGYNLKGFGGGAGRSRKGKKSGGSGGGGGGAEKPVKQPQRGLGVAQLEKIRLQSQMMSEYAVTSSSFHGELDLDDSRVEMMMRSSSSTSSSNMGSTSGSSSLFSLHHHHLPGGAIGCGDGERRSFSYGDQYSWPADYSSTRSQERGGASPFNYYPPAAAAVTLPLFEQSVDLQEESTRRARQKRRSQHDRSSSMGSIGTQMNIYSDSNEQREEEEEEEVDLELRLSL